MKTIYLLTFALLLITNSALSQEKMYIYKGGAVLYSQSVNNIDSITFKEVINNNETVTDIDGNVYHTVTIGTQTWMVENLKTTRYRNGDTIPHILNPTVWETTYTGAYCEYDNDPDIGLKYGYIYNWYAAKDIRKIAPQGWHVPTEADWLSLLDNTGYSAKALASKTDWVTTLMEGAIGNNLTINNSSGFNALPTGFRNTNGIFGSIGSHAYFWTSAEHDSWQAKFIPLYYKDTSTRVYENSKTYGFHIRCIKDN